jgi:RNA polymerase sigma-70 factor, ECF subfamily
LDEAPDAVVPWLLGIARNLVRERRRAVGRQAELAASLDLTTRAMDLMAGDIADQVVERATALRALATLSDADRETLTLVAWHGLPSREAARVVGCSQAAFWVRLHRARRRLEGAIKATLPAVGDTSSPTAVPPGPADDRRPVANPDPEEAEANAEAQT